MGEAGVGRFKRYEQAQGSLLPSFVSDALDAGDAAFFIDDVVEGLEMAVFERRYAEMGEHAYSPRMLLKLWLYGAVQGVYSGREIARRIRRDLGFRYLAGDGPYPDFRTVNRFRLRHREEFGWVLRETVELGRRAGLCKLGVVAIDGTKRRANTSRHKAMSYGRMRQEEQRLEEEIRGILRRMDEVNAAEDEEHGEDDDGGGGLPTQLQEREERLAKIRELRERLERERGKSLEARHQKSFADPDAQMMKTSDGALVYAYNAQAAVSEDGLIVVAAVTSETRDIGQLVPMVEAIESATGQKPEVVLADNGYLTESNLASLRERGQRHLLAVAREGKKASRWPSQPETQRMHRMMRLPWAKRLYARRKTQGERPFAEISEAMKFRRFALRGLNKVRAEWELVCAAFNLRRLNAVLAVPV